jgi:urease accessory protein
MSSLTRVIRWSLLPLALAYGVIAQAHIQPGEGGGFASGLQHPVSGLDHVVAMVAVGIWGAQLGQPALWVLPVTFPIVMAIGGALGLVGVPLPGVEVGIAASAITLGAMILAAARPPLALCGLLVAIFAIFHGYAHGAELAPGDNGLLYSLGFIISTGFLHAAGILLGLIYRWPWGQLALRLLGGAVSVVGSVFLWYRVV